MIESRGLLDIAFWLPDAVVVVDGSAKLIWANDAAERLFGVDSTRHNADPVRRRFDPLFVLMTE